MLNRKGFTLIELMVVILIVAILAAVAIPILRGRIDAAKWSEAKAGAGSLSVALRTYVSEGGDPTGFTTPASVGFADGDLDGTYFTDNCYVMEVIDPNNWVITVTADADERPNAPTVPPILTLTYTNGEVTWGS